MASNLDVDFTIWQEKIEPCLQDDSIARLKDRVRFQYYFAGYCANLALTNPTEQVDRASLLVKVYCLFLYFMKLKRLGDIFPPLMPSPLIEEVWNTHLQDLQGYINFCNSYFGILISPNHNRGLPVHLGSDDLPTVAYKRNNFMAFIMQDAPSLQKGNDFCKQLDANGIMLAMAFIDRPSPRVPPIPIPRGFAPFSPNATAPGIRPLATPLVPTPRRLSPVSTDDVTALEKPSDVVTPLASTPPRSPPILPGVTQLQKRPATTATCQSNKTSKPNPFKISVQSSVGTFVVENLQPHSLVADLANEVQVKTKYNGKFMIMRFKDNIIFGRRPAGELEMPRKEYVANCVKLLKYDAKRTLSEVGIHHEDVLQCIHTSDF